MCRLSWLPLVVACAGVALSAESLFADQLDEDAIRKTVLIRFDENRNDKLDLGEAKQARVRLRNLLEDKSSREINILTWRDDVHELLRRFDQDKDNHLTPDERDAAARLLERIIPKVESEKPEAERPSSSSSGASSNKSGGFGTSERDRSQRIRGVSGSGGVYGLSMGGGGFGSSMGYVGGANGSTFNGYGNAFAGVGGIDNTSSGRLGSSSVGSTSSSSGSQSDSGKTATSGMTSGSSGGLGGSGGSAPQQSPPQSFPGMGSLGDTPPNRPFPSAGGANNGTFPGALPSSDSGAMRPGGTMPGGLAGPSGGLTPPTGSGLSGPTLTPPIPKPNF